MAAPLMPSGAPNHSCDCFCASKSLSLLNAWLPLLVWVVVPASVILPKDKGAEPRTHVSVAKQKEADASSVCA